MIWRRSFDPRSLGSLVLWLDDQQAAGAWSAKVGFGAAQYATNNQPRLDKIGHRPAMNFDGINDSMALPLIPIASWHAFAVANPVASGARTVLQIAASGTQVFNLQSSTTGLQILTASGSPSQTADTFYAESVVGAGRDGGFARNFYGGLLGEVLVYSSVLDEGQATAVTQYLSKKWGL